MDDTNLNDPPETPAQFDFPGARPIELLVSRESTAPSLAESILAHRATRPPFVFRNQLLRPSRLPRGPIHLNNFDLILGTRNQDDSVQSAGSSVLHGPAALSGSGPGRSTGAAGHNRPGRPGETPSR